MSWGELVKMRQDLANFKILEESVLNCPEDMDEVEKAVWNEVNEMPEEEIQREFHAIFN